ncbi:MAG TPA: dienelactone hydrolase family protein [Candidatus Limnocylindria bacterium]|jgi:carboxymethylenebutenolidase|nr:dienelactone hydrolase family protein [Candidatus Limnocylindria bacterium]
MKRILLCAAVLLTALTLNAQDWAKARLEKSPRHGEWVKVKHGDREVNCFITYPEVKDKATAVVVIHEIFGLSDWARSVTDELAEAGYIAIAPDLLSGSVPNGGTEELIKSGGNVGKAIQALPPAQITADLQAVTDYVKNLPACNGKVAVGGFCWGGGQTFRFATNSKEIKAAFAFYGTGPDKEEDIARITVPVYGFYAGNDARVDATVPASTELMKKLGKTYEPVIYDGAGHGFMRAGEAPDTNAANKKAREEAWKRWLAELKKL